MIQLSHAEHPPLLSRSTSSWTRLTSNYNSKKLSPNGSASPYGKIRMQPRRRNLQQGSVALSGATTQDNAPGFSTPSSPTPGSAGPGSTKLGYGNWSQEGEPKWSYQNLLSKSVFCFPMIVLLLKDLQGNQLSNRTITLSVLGRTLYHENAVAQFWSYHLRIRLPCNSKASEVAISSAVFLFHNKLPFELDIIIICHLVCFFGLYCSAQLSLCSHNITSNSYTLYVVNYRSALFHIRRGGARCTDSTAGILRAIRLLLRLWVDEGPHAHFCS